MEKERCAVRDPHARLHWFASSPEAERGSCARCGAMMLFRSTRWPTELHVTLAHFTTPVDRAPQVHYWWDAHVEWSSVDPADGLPRMTPAQ
jgi:hypothetical protein